MVPIFPPSVSVAEGDGLIEPRAADRAIEEHRSAAGALAGKLIRVGEAGDLRGSVRTTSVPVSNSTPPVPRFVPLDTSTGPYVGMTAPVQVLLLPARINAPPEFCKSTCRVIVEAARPILVAVSAILRCWRCRRNCRRPSTSRPSTQERSGRPVKRDVAADRVVADAQEADSVVAARSAVDQDIVAERNGRRVVPEDSTSEPELNSPV